VIVWLRVGDRSNTSLLGRVMFLWPIIMQRIERGNRLIEAS
jgi:hypothetical protein